MKLIGTFSLLFTTFVLCKPPTFENPTTYVVEENKENDDFSKEFTDEKPLGFTKIVLPHPPNADRQNPVYEVSGLEGRQIEIRAQTSQHGVYLCVRDNNEGPDGCSPDTINQCYMPSKDTLRFEFYCMESCQSSDVEFYFRIIKSDVGADDLWCTNRETDGYPKDLIAGFPPEKKPAAPTTPAPIKEGSGEESGGITNLPSVLFIATFLSIASCLLH